MIDEDQAMYYLSRVRDAIDDGDRDEALVWLETLEGRIRDIDASHRIRKQALDTSLKLEREGVSGDKDGNLIGYGVSYDLEPDTPGFLTRTDTRKYHVGFIKHVSETGTWRPRYRDASCDEESPEFATIDEARSYLVQRYEKTVYGKDR